jgi:hypothetical protein
MSKSTMVELVDELDKLREFCPDKHKAALTHMILEARNGEYHDFKNKLYICGKLESCAKLRAFKIPEFDALSRRIEAGEFDERADEEDRKTMFDNMNTNGLFLERAYAEMLRAGFPDGCSESQYHAMRDIFYGAVVFIMGVAAVSESAESLFEKIQPEVDEYVRELKVRLGKDGESNTRETH